MATDQKTVSSCVTRFRRIIYVVRLCAKICGVDVTADDYQMNWTTYTLLTLLFNFFCCTGYTIYVKISTEGSYTIIVEVICFATVAVEGLLKVYCFIAERLKVIEAQSFLDKTYLEYEKRGDNYRDVLSKSIAATITSIKGFGIIYILVATACCVFPVGYNAYYNKRILVMQFLLPFIDPSTDTGYWFLFVLHVICLSLGAFGNFASDMYLLVFIGSVPLVKNILCCKFEDLNEMMNQEMQPSRDKVRDAMVDIVLWHKEYLRLLSRAEHIFFLIILAHVICSSTSVVCTTYCMLTGIWPAAPFFLVFSTANLYLYCGLGTIVDISNDDCASLIYTKCSWYKLPISEQRIVLLMLRKSQSTKGLTVGNMAPLTVGTALSLTKAVYSMLMLLMRGRD